MKNYTLQTLLALALVAGLKASPVTRYVDANGTNSISPYTSWATAATNIQNAVDVSFTGDLILVTNGVYQSGSQNNFGANRVNISRVVTVQSVNGPAVTTIAGKWDTATNGPNAIRCVCLVNGAALSGFTLTNGATSVGEFGGGVRCISTNAVVTNCVITGNSAYSLGGGSYYGTLVNCVVSGNMAAPLFAGGSGGGAAYGTLINCLLTQNFVRYTGGAAAYCSLVNCTVVSNSAAAYDGSILGGVLNNSVVYYNHSYYTNADDSNPTIVTNCCLSFSSPGANNFTNPPQFANLAGGDYHLSPTSPCINAGSNSFIAASNDLDGNPRIVGGTVDIGAYEFQGNVRYVNVNSTNPLVPYSDWSVAATNIQDAIDASVAGDVVIVTNGTYSAGSRAVYGSQKFRVAITKAITVQSLNGPATVNILCPPPTAVQMPGVYLTNGAVLSGVTVSNGNAVFGSGGVFPQYGGGVWCESSSAVVTNCWLTHNAAPQNGGGAFRGTLLNCVLTNNSAEFGGGACSNILINCTLARNTSTFVSSAGVGGGGAIYSSLSNCVLAANSANNCMGGGASWSTLNNCAVSNNYAGANGGGLFACIANNSLISSNRTAGSGGGGYSNTLNNCVLRNNFAPTGGGSRFGSLNNCVISNNSAQFGGGASSNTLNNCLLVGNIASATGGGLNQALANDCILVGNISTNYGGGAYGSTLNNCTIVGNISHTSGGGASTSTLNNCIIYYNAAVGGTNDVEANYEYWNGVRNYCCSGPVPSFDNTFNHFMVTNEPAFVDWVNGNYHLQSNSPCINSGNNAYITNSSDYEGNSRISGGTVDIGAYELQNPPSVISYAWLQQYGLPTDGSMDYTNLDGTGLNVYQDWIAGLNPTNPASVLAMSSAVSTNSASGITVTWQSVNNRTYYLQRSSDLAASFSMIQSNIVGQIGTTSYTDTSATNAVPYFYRVGVQ